MPTTITHAVIAAVAAKPFGNRTDSLAVCTAAIIVSVLPDADVIGFALGVRYGDFLGHRGFSHCPFLALIIATICATLICRHYRVFSRNWWKCVLLLFAIAASHGVLDALTDGGLGVAFLSPFSNARYFFPWTPIPVAPIGIGMFLSPWGARIMIWEILFLWLPVFLAASATSILKCLCRRNREANHGE